MNESEIRGRIVLAALADVGVPYFWGGDDPRIDAGLDCSGAVLHWFRAGGIVLADTTAQGLRGMLDPTDQPIAGDLAFYGTDEKATHVVLVLSPGGTAIIGANGGTSPRQDEPAVAYQARMKMRNAMVNIEDKRKAGAGYRIDLLGYGRLPWETAAAT